MEKDHQNTEKDDIEILYEKKLNAFFQEHHLNAFQALAVQKFLRANIADKTNHSVDRIRDWLFAKLNNKICPASDPMQSGCPEIIPGLRAKPFWDSADMPWMKAFEDNFEVIRTELLGLRALKGFQPYRGPSWISDMPAKDGVGSESIDKGQWNVYYLFLHDLKFDMNCKNCPLTVKIIEEHVPRQYHHAFFSAMNSGTHIIKHHGPTNKKLRFHLPLLGVEGSRLRAGNEIKELEVGKPYVFDDSFEHEAWHDGDNTRVILIVDLWHPDLTTDEVKFINLLQKAKMKFEKTLTEKSEDKDNFYSIIEMAQDLLDSNDWWSVNSKELSSYM